MAAKILVLECLTNMHVGNGDVNYNIVDNEVEKDPTTEYPIINSSGVKGSLREFFENKKDPKVNDYFGSDKDKTPGKIKVLSADFVARPVRASEGSKAYYTITTESTVERVSELSKTFINRNLFGNESDNTEKCAVEDIKVDKKIVFGDSELMVMKDDRFRELSLPVMARNKLNNGISENLWYEEIVPHGSIFIVPVLCDDETLLSSFIDSVKDKVIQFGGNASIGYGLCKVSVEE